LRVEKAEMKLRSVLRTAGVLGAALIATPVLAVNFACGPAPMTYLALDSGGGVVVTVGDATGPLVVCNVSATVDGMSPESCQALYSTFLTLRVTGKRAVFYFNSATPSVGGATTCPALGGWITRIPYTVQVED
jgi:hypothetical protein